MASRHTGEMSRDGNAQTVVARLLLEKVRQDKYPSVTQMTLLEEMLPPALAREYIDVLLEKAMSTPTPSVTLMRRIQRVAQQI